MFWVDALVDRILQTYPDKGHFIIRDEKTLSGRVHVGSLRGVVIHGIIAQILEERGKHTDFIFELNDFDPMDNIKDPQNFGKPLRSIPSATGFLNFPEQWGSEFIDVINSLGFFPNFPRLSDQYYSGKFNKWIEIGLTQSTQIREIYKRISGSNKDQNWKPVQIICPGCNRIGTAIIREFNRGLVTFDCNCGMCGTIDPFDGIGAKLSWKLEWPAKWNIYQVDIEGGGKDHCSAGGSRDIGEAICNEITSTNIPFNIPYEFFLVNGIKMSSSKEIGYFAAEIGYLIPPEIIRFLMLRSPPNRPINFDPSGDTIPRLFDQYDQEEKNHTRLWELCQCH